MCRNQLSGLPAFKKFIWNGELMETIKIMNYIIMLVFFICYSYQFVFIPISWYSKKKKQNEAPIHNFAVLIAAKNEELVIGNLIDSINAQDYPKDKVSVFVVADNCTDSTADIAEKHGAVVFRRFDTSHAGKGYALEFILDKIADKQFDGYIVFDADNIIEPNFITEINKTFSSGFDIVTSYRNSKNFGDNWISSGYALWFLRESRYMNQARFAVGSSCGISGTGFLFSDRILKKCNGWNFFCLTEDIEFTIHNVVNGEKIGYCRNAVLYDEQPTSFSQSWRQRLRWARGYLQVLSKYWKPLFKGMFHMSFSCFDMAMCIMPATILTIVSIVINCVATVINIFNAEGLWTIYSSIIQSTASLYFTLFILGAITVATEWKKIHCSSIKKIIYTFTFPLYMFTYLPICVTALFIKPKWEPIYHNRNISIDHICEVSKTNE